MITRFVKRYHGGKTVGLPASMSATRAILVQATEIKRGGLKYLIQGRTLLIETIAAPVLKPAF